MVDTTISIVESPNGYVSVIIHKCTKDRARAVAFYEVLRELWAGDKTAVFIDETNQTKEVKSTSPIPKIERSAYAKSVAHHKSLE